MVRKKWCLKRHWWIWKGFSSRNLYIFSYIENFKLVFLFERFYKKIVPRRSHLNIFILVETEGVACLCISFCCYSTSYKQCRCFKGAHLWHLIISGHKCILTDSSAQGFPWDAFKIVFSSSKFPGKNVIAVMTGGPIYLPATLISKSSLHHNLLIQGYIKEGTRNKEDYRKIKQNNRNIIMGEGLHNTWISERESWGWLGLDKHWS